MKLGVSEGRRGVPHIDRWDVKLSGQGPPTFVFVGAGSTLMVLLDRFERVSLFLAFI